MGSIRIPDVIPSPTQDSERLREAFQGWGTDEKAIIWVLGHRNAQQRRKIRETYQQLYNESLIDRLQSELSGHFKNAVIIWILDPAERDAKHIREALRKKKKKNIAKEIQVIVEVACSVSPDHLMAVRQFYCSLFDCSIEEDISSNISPPLAKVLVGLVSSYRFDGEVVDKNIAKSEAAMLHEAIEKKELDRDNFIWILSTRNVFQLKATFEYYRQDFGNLIDQDIEKCSAGDLGAILRVVVWCIATPETYFAEAVHASVDGLGTDEDALTRAIVSRADVDMMKIRGEYFNMYNTSLDNAVADDTSGDYKDFLMTLLGARL